jgi:hypothetical protein
MPYNYIAGIDEDNSFPPTVRQAIADATEMQDKYAHLADGVLVVGTTPVSIPGVPAAINTVGWLRAVFIPHGGTVPVGTPAYTLVIEADA